VWVQAEVIGGEESTDASLATKGDHVRAASVSVLQMPMLVSPHFSSLSHSSLRLIGDEGNTLSLGKLSELLVEGR